MQRAGAWTAIWTPISLAYCASVLRERGFGVRLIDCIIDDISLDGLEKQIQAFRPDFVVLNVVTPSFKSDISTVKTIKKINNNIKTAIIGIHGTALPDQCFSEEPLLDFVVRHEPEITLLELLLAIQGGSQLSTIDGISYIYNGHITHNKNRAPINNLDDLPFPAYDLIHREKYTMPFTNKPFLLVGSGRGCPYPCIYCADHVYYGKKIRLRSPKSLVDELTFYKTTFGIEDFLFWSEGFTLKPIAAKEFAEEIMARNLSIRWVCNSRVDNIDREMISLFKKAGCTTIGYGIESGSQEILDKVKKRITIAQIRNTVRITKEADIEVVAHTIIGLPGETRETINQTIDLLLELDVDFAQFYCAVPFPGSPLYTEATKNKWINTSDWKMFEQNFSVLDTPELSAKEIMELRNKAYKKFYFRPKIIYRTLKKIRSFKDLNKFTLMAKEFLDWFY